MLPYIKTLSQINNDASLKIIKSLRSAIIIRDEEAKETARWEKVHFNGHPEAVYVKTRDIKRHKR